MSNRLKVVPSPRRDSDASLPIEVVRLSADSEAAIRSAVREANCCLAEVERLCILAGHELDRKLQYSGSTVRRPRVNLRQKHGRVRLRLSYGE